MIVVEVGQFLFGMMDGSIERKQTPNVDKLLSEDSLKFLYRLGRDTDGCQQSTYVYIWDKEKAITKTTITPTSDNDGRKDLLNRTIIIKFDNPLQDILHETNLLETVEKGLKPLG